MHALSALFSWILLAGLAALLLLPQALPYLPFAGLRSPLPISGAEPTERATLSGPYTLAISWQPAFCETAPQKPECQSQTSDRYDASHFTLHGLWPDPAGRTYCDVRSQVQSLDEAGRWDDLPALQLTADLRARLDTLMPGTMSNLQRHEWIKHGTCADVSAQDYFAASLDILDSLNQSSVLNLFTQNLRQQIRASEIRVAFDQAFGNGTGERVQVECENDGQRTLITELRISLGGEITGGTDLGDAVRNGATRPRGCPTGDVDIAGYQ